MQCLTGKKGTLSWFLETSVVAKNLRQPLCFRQPNQCSHDQREHKYFEMEKDWYKNSWREYNLKTPVSESVDKWIDIYHRKCFWCNMCPVQCKIVMFRHVHKLGMCVHNIPHVHSVRSHERNQGLSKDTKAQLDHSDNSLSTLKLVTLIKRTCDLSVISHDKL